MRRELIGAAVGLSASILLTSLGLAAQAPTTEDFVKTVAISDMFEVQSGQLASEKAQNGDVRSFGKQMVADHTKTSDQLKKLVADKDIKVELPANSMQSIRPIWTSSMVSREPSSTKSLWDCKSMPTKRPSHCLKATRRLVKIVT